LRRRVIRPQNNERAPRVQAAQWRSSVRQALVFTAAPRPLGCPRRLQ
jgi:hypothetical protein